MAKGPAGIIEGKPEGPGRERSRDTTTPEGEPGAEARTCVGPGFITGGRWAGSGFKTTNRERAQRRSQGGVVRGNQWEWGERVA